jgi:hypothetical protein
VGVPSSGKHREVKKARKAPRDVIVFWMIGTLPSFLFHSETTLVDPSR